MSVGGYLTDVLELTPGSVAMGTALIEWAKKNSIV